MSLMSRRSSLPLPLPLLPRLPLHPPLLLHPPPPLILHPLLPHLHLPHQPLHHLPLPIHHHPDLLLPFPLPRRRQNDAVRAQLRPVLFEHAAARLVVRREPDEHDPERAAEFVDLGVVADDGPVDGEPLLDLLVGHEGREVGDEDLSGRGRAGGVIVVLQTNQPNNHMYMKPED